MHADIVYSAVVAVAVGLHFLFIGYLLCGGFLAWRHPRTIWLHAAAAVWALCITFVPYLECPLTIAERWARREGGMAPLPSDGFISYYITGVFYPRGAAGAVEAAVMLLVVASWVGFALRLRRRHADGAVPTDPSPAGRIAAAHSPAAQSPAAPSPAASPSASPAEARSPHGRAPAPGIPADPAAAPESHPAG